MVQKQKDMSYYIRFTSDIDADITRGFSKNIHGQKLNGLCAWPINFDYNPFDKDSIIEAAKSTASMIAKNSYAGYGSDTEFAVVEGQMTGGYTNDGTLIKVIKVLGEFSI